MNTSALNTAQETTPSWRETLMDNVVVEYTFKILWAIAVIIVLLLISKIIANIVRRNILKSAPEGSKHIDKVGKLIHDIVFYVLVIFSFFIGFEVVGFNVWLILWWISFGVWLAFKEILWNMIAGIMMLYTKEFKLWDIVEINADQLYFGRIEEITIRYTVIRTLDLRQVVIPNTTLISTPIKTFSAEELVRWTQIFWVHYDTDIAKATSLVAEAINSFDFIKSKENTKVFLSNFEDSSIELKALFYFDPKWGLIPEVITWYIYEKVNEAFNANDIVVPYNMVTLTFEDEEQKEALMKNIQEPWVAKNP